MMKTNATKKSPKRSQLTRTLGRVEVFALAFGTTVGWGTVVIPLQWLELGGLAGTIVTVILTTTMCAFVGLIYAELTSAFPLAGAELAFTYRSMGVVGSWFTGWMVCLAYIGIASFEGIALSMALNYLFPLPQWEYYFSIGGFDINFTWIIIGISGALILVILNIIGIRKAAIFQMLLLLVMLFSVIIYVLGAFAFGDASGETEPVVTNIKGFELVLIMAPSMFVGFDMIAKSAEEINMPLHNLPKVLILSICAVGSWYIVITLATYFLMPQAQGENVSTTAEIAASAFGSSIIMKLILIGGICGIITTWNGFILGASRIIFAMSRAKFLPSIFSKVHPKYNTPVNAIIFVGLFCCIGPFLGVNAFRPFLNIVAFATILAYLMVTISFFLIRKKEPDLRRGFRIKHGKLVWAIALVFVIFFIYWYMTAISFDPTWTYEWIFITVWIGIGIMLFLVFRISEYKNKITSAQREELIFGDEFSREK